MALFRRVKPPFSLKTLQKDSNCIAIQDPSRVWGVQDFLPRRNLLTYSEDFSNAAWQLVNTNSTNPSVSVNASVAPDGTATADRITFGVIDAASDYSVITQSITVQVGTYIGSVYLRAKDANEVGKSVFVYVATNGSTKIQHILTSEWVKVTSIYSVTAAGASGLTIATVGSTYGGGNQSSVIVDVWGAQLTRADTIDQSYQRITDWTTEQYAWAAQKSVPWLRRNRFLNTATLSTQTVSSVTASPITVSFKGTGTITFSTAYSGSLVGTGANNRVTATFTPSAGNLVCTVSGTVTEAQCENGSSTTEYQPILASWDATYTQNAIAAGYPISLWQDAAGTTAVNGDNQAIGACRDLKYADYSGGSELATGNGSVNGSPITVSNASLSNIVQISIPTTVGKVYFVTFSVLWTSGTYQVSIRNSSDTNIYDFIPDGSIGTYINKSLTIVAPTNTISVRVRATNNLYATVQNISVREIPGYTAIQSTAANQPKWRLDANGKGYIERDLTNDSLPITLPNLGSACAIYVGEGATVTESLAQTISGSYAPITPAKDYGRVIFQTPTSKSAKVVKWLLAKAGY